MAEIEFDLLDGEGDDGHNGAGLGISRRFVMYIGENGHTVKPVSIDHRLLVRVITLQT